MQIDGLIFKDYFIDDFPVITCAKNNAKQLTVAFTDIFP